MDMAVRRFPQHHYHHDHQCWFPPGDDTKKIGFRSDQELNDSRLLGDIQRDLKKTFRPEFLNRVDEIIPFHVLTREQVLEIVDLQMNEISLRLEEHTLKVELTDLARRALVAKGYDPEYGARPVAAHCNAPLRAPQPTTPWPVNSPQAI